VAVVVILVLWEVVARLWFAGSTSIAPPSAVFAQLWSDRDLVVRNTSATLLIAVLGFLLGNLVAVATAVAFVLVSPLERIFSPLALALYALPTLVLAPVLGVFFDAGSTRVIVAALVVYFPTLVAVTAGLREPTTDALDLVRSLGGGRLTALRLVRARWALPGLCSGMRVAVPGALLGAIASEWLGTDTGLGIFMVNALGYLNTARVWACCLVCVVLTVAGYGLVGLLNSLVNRWHSSAREQV
jgi:ABC-type nitrate/sulfonate/bicarbonate transport system permease component